ncbi:DUF6221 family protein [Streptomyces zhihengii]
MADDLLRFLRDRLDDDERNARARCGIFPSPGVDDEGHVWLHIRPGGNAVVTRYAYPVDGYDDMAKLRSWADTDSGWTDRRVLAEVKAKRQVLTEAFRHAAKVDGEWGCCHSAEQIEAGQCEEHCPDELPLVRILAAPYADHPAYRAEWRP